MANGVLRDREQLEQAFRKISKSLSFDGAHLELSTDARTGAIATFLIEHFLPDEPLSKSIGLLDDLNSDVGLLNEMLSENLSVLLISDATDEVIGVRVITISKKTDDPILPMLTNEKMKTIQEFIEHKDADMDVFRYYDVDVVVHFLSLGVHRDFRRRGYASKLMQAAIAFSQELGLEHVCIKGEGTSNFSKLIYEKWGFETLHEMKYDEYKKNGEVIFKNTGEHKSCKVYAKRF